MSRHFLFLFAAALAAAQVRPGSTRNASRLDLTGGWMIQSSAAVTQTGDRISSPQFDTPGWYPATVPTTVVRALVDDGLFADPYYGLNLRSIPGTTYDFGDNFAVDPMPPDS